MNKNLKPFFLGYALVLTIMSPAQSSENSVNTLMKTQSEFDYQQTRERLLKTISDNGLVLFGEFDHAAGLTMLPTTVLIFGNPKGEHL